MMTAAEFWKQQKFSYLLTYSFNRGPKLSALQRAAKSLFQQTRSALLTAGKHQLPALREQLRLLERTHDLDLLTLTQGSAAFHITASPIAKIEKNALAAQELAGLLQGLVSNQLHLMCGPVYRDALAFYDEQDQLLSVLNVCFGCNRMVTASGQEIEADTTTYQALRTYLLQLGHPIVAGEG